jgi:hypothetical protein
MGLLGDEAQVEAQFGPFRDSATLDARLEHVCVEHTLGSEVVRRHPMEFLGDMGLVESRFDLF